MKSEKITDEVIKCIERAAMLQLSGAELAQVKGDLEQIIAYMDRLQELDTSQIKPVLHPFPETGAFRADQADDQGVAEALKAQAPEEMDDWYMVPQAIKTKQPGSGVDR